MKAFYSDDFPGMWPVGVCAIVVANDKRQAKRVLTKTLKEHWLAKAQDAPAYELVLKDLNLVFDGSLVRIDLNQAHAIIVNDGDY